MASGQQQDLLAVPLPSLCLFRAGRWTIFTYVSVYPPSLYLQPPPQPLGKSCDALTTSCLSTLSRWRPSPMKKKRPLGCPGLSLAPPTTSTRRPRGSRASARLHQSGQGGHCGGKLIAHNDLSIKIRRQPMGERSISHLEMIMPGVSSHGSTIHE